MYGVVYTGRECTGRGSGQELEAINWDFDLAKELETINWDFVIENKTVHTTTGNGSNFAKAFNVYGETAETAKEEGSDEERSSCSSGNADEDMIQPVRLLFILEGDNDEEGVGVFLPNICVMHHTLSILWQLLMLARL